MSSNAAVKPSKVKHSCGIVMRSGVKHRYGTVWHPVASCRQCIVGSSCAEVKQCVVVLGYSMALIVQLWFGHVLFYLVWQGYCIVVSGVVTARQRRAVSCYGIATRSLVLGNVWRCPTMSSSAMV